MFTKVSNVDLFNKLCNIDNKMDIILTKLKEETVHGCCDCRQNESRVYREIKVYLEEKIGSLEVSLIGKLGNVDVNVQELKSEIDAYRAELVNNLEYIIDNMDRECRRECVDVNVDEFSKKVEYLAASIKEIDKLSTRVEESLIEVSDAITGCKDLVDFIVNGDIGHTSDSSNMGDTSEFESNTE